MFDIDGTLIDSSGAGGGALLTVLQSLFRVSEPAPVKLHGRTDKGIMADLLADNGVEPTAENLAKLTKAYFERLPTELERRQGQVLPGVESLLRKLAETGRSELGLLTGNMPESAQAKLEHFGLWENFDFGIYGDLAAHRPALADPAWSRIRGRFGGEVEPSQVIIVGDTPLDIELAIAMRVRSVAVCTGGFAAEELAGAGADWVLDDLTNTQGILDWCFKPTERISE